MVARPHGFDRLALDLSGRVRLEFKNAAVWSFMRPGPLKESLARARARGLAGS
jgi:hypothetical protein